MSSDLVEALMDATGFAFGRGLVDGLSLSAMMDGTQNKEWVR